MTVTGDYAKVEVEEQWQVECTEHQIAFQCCTDDCVCHDPVVSAAATSSTNDIAFARDTTTDTGDSPTSSVAADIVVSAVGLAAVAGVGVFAMQRSANNNPIDRRDALQVALSSSSSSDYAAL